MMNISIVSGTYNRLPSLQRMVESARRSFLYGLSCQFVLVDGGSQDGTQEWCHSQPDILLIEHGKLLGAVKAFNDGAYAAAGEYVILANDDIEFVDESILLAYLYMQNYPDCGVGCFFQNRNGRDWHVEEMPCVIDSEQRTTPYGQVCIVPKWLGDYVGWWGDYLHTYGGDNELSSRVLEVGFKVSPIIQQGKQARIADHELDDDLRKINNLVGGGKDPRAVKGHHPDSWAWGRKWKHFDLAGQPVGAIVRTIPLLDNPIQKRHRFMYLPIYEQGWQVQKEQKRGLREALSKVGLVYEYDYIEQFTKLGKQAMLLDLQSKMRHIEPTVFLSQLHNGAQINGDDISLIRQSWPDTYFVNWNGDFWPDNLLSEDGLNLAKSFNLQLGINRDAIEKQRQNGINADYWQIGFEPDGVGFEADTFCDVVFLASGYSQARQTLVSKLRRLDCVFHLYGPGWKDSQGVTIYDFKAGCRIYQGAKISIGDSQWPETGFVSNRVFQALAAGGAALAHQWFMDMDKLGLVDGETCIIWRTFEELETKIRYYLSHEEERKRIADNGQKMCLERHSFDVRVKELLGMITPSKQEKETSWRW